MKLLLLLLSFTARFALSAELNKIHNFIKVSETGDTSKIVLPRFKINYPLYGVSVGIGIVNGVNLKGSVRFVRSFSFQTSYGRNLIFNSGTKTDFYCFGFNYYGSTYSGLIVSFLGGVKHNTYESSGIISPNIGYFSIGKRGLLFQFRGGFQFYTNTGYLDEGSSFLDYITFDISLGTNF